METVLLERLDRIEQLIKTHILTKQDWLTVQQFAVCVGLNSKYVSELCKTGKVMATRSTERHGRNFTWRIRREELERFQREGQLTSE